MTERGLSFAERAVWGQCPVCQAVHGLPCDDNIGRKVISEDALKVDAVVVGAHVGRLQNAPYTVIIAV